MMPRLLRYLLLIVCISPVGLPSQVSLGQSPTALPRLKISDNKRFLSYENGQPFFYLGDTAWELFHRLNREEAERYLRDRAAKGYTVIQAVVLGELDGLTEPNAYGHTPLTDKNPDKPNEAYFQHVDWILGKAEELGLYIGLLPTWGSYWNPFRSPGTIFTPENAGRYGEWLGRRYQNRAVIWIVGGDRRIETDEQRQVVVAMAQGLKRGDGGKHLVTFHPTGEEKGSAGYFHDADWLDFNMRQNGHAAIFNGAYDVTLTDYKRTPPKPIIDGEPLYEDHSVAFDPKKQGWSVAADVRRPLYWNLFQGAFGHTYGHHSIWQMWAPGRTRNALMSWEQALSQPGAEQMQYARYLLESRPFYTRIPDDSVIVSARVPDEIPGAGLRRFVATRDSEGSYAMVYVPVSRPFNVRMDKVTGGRRAAGAVRAWWFNPRDGSAQKIGEYPASGEREFVPPNPGELLDWVLVLDDTRRNFTAPGTRPKATKR